MMATQYRRRMAAPPRAGRTIREKLIALGFLAFAGLTVTMGIRGKSAMPFTPTYSSPPATVRTNSTACVSEAALQRAMSFGTDQVALGKFLLDPTSGCTMIDSGTPVQVDEYKGSVQRFHIRGSPDSLWSVGSVIR